MPIAPEHLHLAYTGPFYTYLYGRASRDPRKKGRSVTDQLSEGRDVCTENGWPIIGEFRDDDRSASRYSKRTREEFEELLAGVEQGIPRIVVAFEASRYYRDLEAYVALRRACMAGGVLLCYDGAVYDLSKRADRKATAQDAINAEDEADGIRDRNLRTVRLNAKAGGPHGRILWGYLRQYDPKTGELEGQFKHPDRAPVVKDVFARFVAGETVYSIRQHLRNTRNASEDGREWEYHHVMDMLRNPSYIGRRVYQGQDHAKGQWAPIIKPEVFAAAQRILANPERASTKDWTVKHLAAGIARCGECPPDTSGRPPRLRANPSDGAITYLCSEKFDVSMRKAKFEAYVTEAVVEWLASKAPAEAFTSTDRHEKAEKARVRHRALVDQLADARARATTIRDDGTPALSLDSLTEIEDRLRPMIARAETESEEVAVPPLLRQFMGQDREAVDLLWSGLTIEQQRAVLRLIVNIRLHKAARPGTKKIEPGRITLTFVGEPGFTSG
jgi:DNA invertase Pin-like site-specific DNA recombinase